MIRWLIGDNSFAIRQAVQAVIQESKVTPERFDGDQLALTHLADIFGGLQLFQEQRLVIIDGIATNATLWPKLPEWLPRVSDTTDVVFIDNTADKRTATYKYLANAADVQEFPAWTDRDKSTAIQWLQQRAKMAYDYELDRSTATAIVERAGYDQWQLDNALQVLTLNDTITADAITDAIIAPTEENVFSLLETALGGDGEAVQAKLARLTVREDPYRVFGLLSSQVLNIAALRFQLAGGSAVKEVGIHPYAARSLEAQGRRLSKPQVGQLLTIFADADADLKRSRGEPWLVIEKALFQTIRAIK